MMAKRSPPIPFPVGSIRPMVAFAAMAASIAFPPRSRIRTPAPAARGWLAATMPYFVATTERPTTGPWPEAIVAASNNVHTRRSSFMTSPLRFPWIRRAPGDRYPPLDRASRSPGRITHPGHPWLLWSAEAQHFVQVAGEDDGERRPLPHLAFNPNLTVMILHDLVADGESQSGSHPHAFGGETRIEYLVQLLLG